MDLILDRDRNYIPYGSFASNARNIIIYILDHYLEYKNQIENKQIERMDYSEIKMLEKFPEIILQLLDEDNTFLGSEYFNLSNQAAADYLWELNAQLRKETDKNFSSMKVLNQYFMSAECQEINHIDEFNVTFNKKLKIADNKEIECMNSYFEIVPTKSIKLKKTADCFIIFFDLEYNDSLGELNKILKNLANLGTNDKKLIIVRFYMEEKDIKTNSDEKSIPNILDKYGFSIFDISI